VYGNCYELTSPEAPALLLRKQSSYNETFSVKLDFRPSRLGYEAGIALWWHQYSFATIGLGVVKVPDTDETKTTIVIREPLGKNGEFKVCKLIKT
jgi:hypothetical protein